MNEDKRYFSPVTNSYYRTSDEGRAYEAKYFNKQIIEEIRRQNRQQQIQHQQKEPEVVYKQIGNNPYNVEIIRRKGSMGDYGRREIISFKKIIISILYILTGIEGMYLIIKYTESGLDLILGLPFLFILLVMWAFTIGI